MNQTRRDEDAHVRLWRYMGRHQDTKAQKAGGKVNHYLLFQCGEWLCALSIALFIIAGVVTLRNNHNDR